MPGRLALIAAKLTQMFQGIAVLVIIDCLTLGQELNACKILHLLCILVDFFLDVGIAVLVIIDCLTLGGMFSLLGLLFPLSAG
ncbi:hypothetical protein CEXT_9401 [Caerostris extrusa]|uniref:Uncharacterized protein n=1 Tax=Caerostris extrusa TaxID=172846 RepID=A0AAV4NQS4_CAEEX|nr:hypothetical protein CEXT_9401 [Caerostris extrusa]